MAVSTSGSAAAAALVDGAPALLRFATAGSVDDGKSTLIGRLLYDSKAIFEDQLDHVTEVSRRRGDEQVNLALLTDGLRAEREQGITIDVAYRYFATPRRRFIIADTPGHVQYTRNMATGASTADLSVVLVDARNGVGEQSKRHAYISSLLGVPHLAVCVNKMDLVGWSEERFDEIVREFSEYAKKLDVGDVTFIPISALHGDNVVDRSENMPWYGGQALLPYLEELPPSPEPAGREAKEGAGRFPVQWVIRPQSDAHHDYRGYAGTVAGGVFRPGDEVVVLPSGHQTRVAAIDTYDDEVAEAFAPMSVTLRLADDIDVSRGDMICHREDAPEPVRELEAVLCWMAERPLQPGGRYAIKHTTRSARAVVDEVVHRVEVGTLDSDPSAETLQLNDIGHVRLRISTPLLLDEYAANRSTGCFILIDEATNDTVAAGMVASA